jgi:RNA polymerase sigma-70 factor (ECF subfamily)
MPMPDATTIAQDLGFRADGDPEADRQRTPAVGRTVVMESRAVGAHQERSLARRLRAGDETALAELYDAHSGFVFGLATRVIGDRVAAEDVTQDVFVTLWNQPERYEPDRGSLRAFLGTLTHRRAVDHIRREEARRRREDKVATEPNPPPEIDEGIIRTATTRVVREAVALLPPAQRQAIELAWFEGHTYREVADLLGIPEGTAKSRLRLALARIAEVLSPEVSEQWA